ncbi:MAG: presqualene diphosphate synthase HpnD [Proteobacteria bacterium]|nr:presqualene diphosphate synthase HpnD [Pseudomonadota bacterium]
MTTLSPPPDPNVLAHVESVVRRSGSSFYWAMRCLPAEKRRAMYGIYAFCRQVDDIADGTGQAEEKRAQLGQWGGEIERLYGDHPRNPVVRALLGPVEDFGLHKEDFRAIIAGMEMDADDRVRIKDMDELNLYCERVACAVGRLSVCVFGVDDDKGKELAFSLGQALQLTNILRDIAEDAERDRLYIPEDLLRSYDVVSEDLPSVLNHPEFHKVCDTLAGVAERRFQQAETAIAECDREKIRPAIMMMEIYRRIFQKLRRRGWKLLNLPVGISKPRKIWIALRYGFFS